MQRKNWEFTAPYKKKEMLTFYKSHLFKTWTIKRDKYFQGNIENIFWAQFWYQVCNPRIASPYPHLASFNCNQRKEKGRPLIVSLWGGKRHRNLLSLSRANTLKTVTFQRASKDAGLSGEHKNTLYKRNFISRGHYSSHTIQFHWIGHEEGFVPSAPNY